MMKQIIGSIKLKVTVLTMLIGLTLHFGFAAKPARACPGLECVQLTGALCVGCLHDAPNGYPMCEINQDECWCNNIGERCID
jgi:hypothetical protein